MTYIGDIALSAIIDHKFCTVTTTGAPTVLAGTPAVSVYKDNSTTQSTTGVTLSVDFDSVVGLNNVRVDTSADGTFYSAGSNFQIIITTGTVGGTSVVGYVVGSFSINNRSGLRPTTAGRTLDVSAGGEAGIDWANVGTPGSTVGLSATTVATVTTLTNNNDKAGYELSTAGNNGVADAYLDRDDAIETGYTPRQAERLILSSSAAKLSGAATTTVTIRDVTDTKNRITATVDADGNRTAVTLDAT